MLPLFLIMGLLVSCHSASYGNRAKNKQFLASKQKDDQLIEKESDTNKFLANKEQSQTEEPKPKNKHQETNETKTTEESQPTNDPSQTEEPQQKNKQQQNNEYQTIKESQTKNEPSENEEQPTNQNQTTEESQIKNEPSQTEESQQQKEEPQKQKEEPQQQKEEPQQQNKEPQQQKEEPQQQKEEPQQQKEEPQQQKEEPQQQNEEPNQQQNEEQNEKLQQQNEELQQQNEEPQQQNEEPQKQNEEAQPKIEPPQKDKPTPNLELREEHIPKAKELTPKKEVLVHITKSEQESQKIQPENSKQSELQRNQMDKTDFQLSKYYNFKPIKTMYKSPNIKFMPKLQKYIQPRFEQYAKSLSKTNIWTGPLLEESIEPILQRHKRPKFPNYVKPIYKNPPVSNQQPLEPIHSEIHTNEIPHYCSSTQRDGSKPGNPYNYVRDGYGGKLTSDGDTTNIRHLFDSYVVIQPAYSDRIDPGTDISTPVKELVYDELPYIYHPENYYQH